MGAVSRLLPNASVTRPKAPAQAICIKITSRNPAKTVAEISFHQFPAARNAAADVQLVIAFQKIGGGLTGAIVAGCGLRRERGGEFRKLRQRAEFRVAFRLGARLAR